MATENVCPGVLPAEVGAAALRTTRLGVYLINPSPTCVMLSKPTTRLFDVRHTFVEFTVYHFHLE